MIPSVGCWVFLGALAFHYAEAQRQCNGTVISQAASMPAQYPPAGQVANLVDGDEAGKALFNASQCFRYDRMAYRNYGVRANVRPPYSHGKQRHRSFHCAAYQ